MRLTRTGAGAVLVAMALAGCSGPGSGATFDPDAPGAAEDSPGTDVPDVEETRPVVRGREAPDAIEEADLDDLVGRACGRAVTPSGRYSQAGYDRGVAEGVEAGATEEEMEDGIEEMCGDDIREARGDG